MKAVLYEIEISESWLHSTHGMSYTIFEIFIPSFKVFLNHEGVWKAYNGRYKKAKKIKEIDIPITDCKILADSIAYKETSEKISKKILKENTIGIKTQTQTRKENYVIENHKKTQKEIKAMFKKTTFKKRKKK